MFENLKKVLLYALSSNVPELAAFLISMVAQVTYAYGQSYPSRTYVRIQTKCRRFSLSRIFFFQ